MAEIAISTAFDEHIADYAIALPQVVGYAHEFYKQYPFVKWGRASNFGWNHSWAGTRPDALPATACMVSACWCHTHGIAPPTWGQYHWGEMSPSLSAPLPEYEHLSFGFLILLNDLSYPHDWITVQRNMTSLINSLPLAAPDPTEQIDPVRYAMYVLTQDIVGART